MNEGLGSLNVREIILALYLRMQRDCKSTVDTHFDNILSTNDADIQSTMSSAALLMKGNLASSKLAKMRILSSVLQQGSYRFLQTDRHFCSMDPSYYLTIIRQFTTIVFYRTRQE